MPQGSVGWCRALEKWTSKVLNPSSYGLNEYSCLLSSLSPVQPHACKLLLWVGNRPGCIVTDCSFSHRVSRSLRSRKCPHGTCSRVRRTQPLCPGPGSALSAWTGRWSRMRNSTTSFCTTRTPCPSPEATTSSHCPCLLRRKRKNPRLQFLRNQKGNRLSCQIKEKLQLMKRRRQREGSVRQNQAHASMWVGDVRRRLGHGHLGWDSPVAKLYT